MDGNGLFADKRKYLGEKVRRVPNDEADARGDAQQGLPINAGEFSVIVVQKVYPAFGKQACNADVQAV